MQVEYIYTITSSTGWGTVPRDYVRISKGIPPLFVYHRRLTLAEMQASNLIPYNIYAYRYKAGDQVYCCGAIGTVTHMDDGRYTISFGEISLKWVSEWDLRPGTGFSIVWWSIPGDCWFTSAPILVDLTLDDAKERARHRSTETYNLFAVLEPGISPSDIHGLRDGGVVAVYYDGMHLVPAKEQE